MIAVVEHQIDPRKYGRLLAKTLPKEIETEEEHERMCNIVDTLMSKGEGNITPEEAALLDLLYTLIEKYDDEHYPLPEGKPLDMLKHIMESRDVKPKDLWEVFGSKGVTSEVLSGKRQISKTHAKGLAKYFNVSVEFFI
jgi:HTH-type transcriptional regulator / antitoxin HigA